MSLWVVDGGKFFLVYRLNRGVSLKWNKAFVTLVSGDAYQVTSRKFCLPGWKAYADRYGYDIVALTEHIDGSAVGLGRPVHWQKLLIAEHALVRDYENVVWLDSDIAINPYTAPCIVRETEEDSPVNGTSATVFRLMSDS